MAKYQLQPDYYANAAKPHMEGAPRTSKALFERASGTIGNKPEKQPLQETRSPLRAKIAIGSQQHAPIVNFNPLAML